MVIVTLKQLKFEHFKGIEQLEVDFHPKETTIYGKNGTGKSTIEDGFHFLLFNKNSNGEERFSKKPLDQKGESKKNVNNVVSGVFDINGKEVTLEHIHTEKWVKDEFAGNENVYKYNGVPTKPREYAKMVDEIITEETFKMVTNPFFFNSLPPEVKRSYIEQICGTMTDLEIAEKQKKYNELIDDINLISIEKLKAKLRADKSDIQKEVNRIPIRVQEAMHNIPEAINQQAIQDELSVLQSKYAKFEKLIVDINSSESEKNNATKERARKIGELELENQRKVNKHKSDFENEVQKANSEQIKLNQELGNIKARTTTLRNELANLPEVPNKVTLLKNEILEAEQKIIELRAKYDAVNALVFEVNDSSFRCRYCGEMPTDVTKIESNRARLREEFNFDQNHQLDALVSSANKQKELIKNHQTDIESLLNSHVEYAEKLSNQISELDDHKTAIGMKLLDLPNDTKSVESVEDRIANDSEYKENLKSIELLNTEVSANAVVESKSELALIIRDKALIGADIDKLKRIMLTVESRNEKLARVEEINIEGTELGRKAAELDRKISLIGSFERKKAELIEKKVSDYFKHVTFKFFDFTLDGEVKSTCEILLNGVPFKDLNTASQYKAGIDIINTISKHFGIIAPIFLDNRESVTDIIETESQIINLTVSNDEQLVVKF